MEVHILKRNNNSLSTPLILINFKTYSEALGEKAVRLAKIAETVSEKTGKCIAVAPQYTDIRRIARETKLPVFAQHIDPIEPGAHTGKILPESIKEAGAIGTLINHSERQMKISDIERCVLSAKSLGLLTVVCAGTANISMATASLNPDIVAIEPPELIGKGKAVSKESPEIIADTIALVRQINKTITILCGAGITSGEDVKAAINLGTEGVLLASGVVKASDQEAVLLDLAIQI